jgi:hypothetical protein
MAPSTEGGWGVAVEKVVGPAVLRQTVVRDVRHIAGQASRGCIDDEVEPLTVQLIEAASLNRAECGSQPCQLMGPGVGPVGDHQLGKSGFEERDQHPACGPARAEQKDPSSRKTKAMVAIEIPDQADPVGVVAAQTTSVESDQGVDRTRDLGAVRPLIRECPGGFLE